FRDADGQPYLEVGAVYTKVTWTIQDDTWASDHTPAPGTKQPTDLSDAGHPATTVIRYRAGVPLFENTLDVGGAASPPVSREQAANLENNRGVSTRHGVPEANTGAAPAKSYRNAAVAYGNYRSIDTSDFDV